MICVENRTSREETKNYKGSQKHDEHDIEGKIGLFGLEKRRQKEEMRARFKYQGPLQWTAISLFPDYLGK